MDPIKFPESIENLTYTGFSTQAVYIYYCAYPDVEISRKLIWDKTT